MKKVLLIFCCVTFFKLSYGTVDTAYVSGDWTNTATWKSGAVPASGDSVFIESGVTVTTIGITSQELTINIPAITIAGTLELGDPSSTSGFYFDYKTNIDVLDGGVLKDNTGGGQDYSSNPSALPRYFIALSLSSSITFETNSYFDTKNNSIDTGTYIYGYNYNGGFVQFYDEKLFGPDTASEPMNIPGHFTITIDNSGNVTTSLALAIRLINFTGTYQPDNGVQLQWTSASEQNNAYFMVQRSLDGHQFENLGKVTGAGTSSSSNKYSFSDGEANKLGSDILYYRLQQFDFDGHSTYSNVIAIHISDEPTLKLWPNPNNGQFLLSFGKIPQQAVTVKIVNANGQLISQQTYQQSKTTINLSNRPKGIYFVQIVYKNGQSKVLRVVVQ